MAGLFKVTIVLLLGAASLHQSNALLSWKPAWKRWPLFGFSQPHSLQGQSPLAFSVWNELDDFWPSGPHSLMTTRPSSALQVPHSRCHGGVWVRHDDKNDVEDQFETEERHLQQREDQLRKEWEDLKNRQEDLRKKEEKRRLEQQQKREEQLRLERMKQQELRAQKERRRMEEQRRVERERAEAKRKMMQDQEARRQQEIHAREERKRLEEQRRLERERQERMRREEIERRRAEEREMRRRQQQEEAERERQMQELKRRQTERKTSEQNIRHKSRNSLPKSEIGNLNIPEGYNLEDITAETISNQILVKGHHLCGCEENCFDREFERRLALPKNVDTRTLSASLYPSGQLTLHGVKYRQVIPPVDTAVIVEGVGLQRTQRTDNSCKLNAKKSGFKLKKMNARTGEIFDDIEPIEETYPLYESEVDEDGLTIEVVE